MKKKFDFDKTINKFQNEYMPGLEAINPDKLSSVERARFEKKIDDLFSQTSIISSSKQFLRDITNKTKNFMDCTFTKIDSINIKDNKTKLEIKKYKKRMYKCWESVKRADYHVMENTNNLLELMMFHELDSAINQKKTTSREEESNILPNLGFSIEDGFSRNPLGKIDILYQVYVFNLIHSLLELHDSIIFFNKRQSDIISILEPNPQLRREVINDFYTELIPQELTRKQCLTIIKDMFKAEGIVNFSECYIKKQLSNWNVYQPSPPKRGKRKKKGPLPGYEKAKRGTKSDFEDWVRKTYIPYHRMKSTNRSFSSRAQEKDVFDENSPRFADLDAAERIRDNVDHNFKQHTLKIKR